VSKAQESISNRDFIRVGRSRIEGKGVFAKRKIPRGTRIIEYAGARVPLERLLVESTDGHHSQVYLFRLNESTIIDGSVNGNDARFINHSCEPNCEAYVFDDRIYIYAMREIVRGEELTFDYKLGPAVSGTRKRGNSQQFVCNCGAPNCRGTLIAKRSRSRSKSSSKENK
jgi:hypothetical protein